MDDAVDVSRFVGRLALGQDVPMPPKVNLLTKEELHKGPYGVRRMLSALGSSPARSPALPESLLDHRKRLAGDGEYGRPGGALLIRGEREIHAAIAAAGAGGDGDPGVGARRGPGAAGVGQHSDAAAGCALNDLRAARREGVAAAAVEGEIGPGTAAGLLPEAALPSEEYVLQLLELRVRDG